MAFFADHDGLCRDKWPGELGAPLAPKESASSLASWRTLPCSFDELCERIVVEGVDRKTTNVLMSHADIDDAGETLAFTVRLQGVVAEVDLKPLGNWKGDEFHAPKAVQILSLASGGYDVAFKPQRIGVMHVEELVMNMLGLPAAGDIGRKGAIRLTRRVFKKVNVSSGQTGVSLNVREDPGGKANKIKHTWIVDHKIKTGVRTDKGTIAPVPALAIRRGDFVDVAAVVEVVTMRTKAGKRTEVQLCPVEVVRLQTGLVTARMLTVNNHTVVSNTMPGQAPEVTPTQITGFVFDDSHEEAADEHDDVGMEVVE